MNNPIRCCGTCKNWRPNISRKGWGGHFGSVDRYCSLTAEYQGPYDRKGCLVWIPKHRETGDQ